MEQDEKKLKNKVKINTIAIVVLLVILLIVLIVVISRIFSVKDGLNNNDSNMGLASQSEKATFYYDYNNGLVKKEKKDKKTLTQDQAYSIYYLDGKVYYTTPSNNGGINIKVVTEDGKDNKIVKTLSSNSTKMFIENNKIYYLTSNPDTISKMNLDGKNEESLLTRSVTDFKVDNGTIYFSDAMGYLYSIDTNGENYKTLIKESKFNEFQILDNYVYYFDDDTSKLMKISLKKTSKKEEVTDKLDCDIYNVTTNGIYYLNKKDGKIEHISLSGKSPKEIVAVNTDNTRINIVGATIYYIDSDGEKSVTKIIGTNGKEIK